MLAWGASWCATVDTMMCARSKGVEQPAISMMVFG